jgi:hypothetical protein
MAGARPSGFKQGGGGAFNGIDGRISDYEFTTEHPFSEKDSDEYIYFVVEAELDGKEEAEKTVLFVGNSENFTIEDGGKTLVPVDPEDGLWVGSGVAKFINSLVTPANGEEGFPESSLPEDAINYEPIIGTRVRFIQVQDVDKNGKPKVRKATKGKHKGKEFPQTHTEIGAVYELPGAKKGAKAAAGKPAAKASAPAASKGGKKAKDEDEGDDVETLAIETLTALLEDNDGELLKKKLPVQVINKLGAKHPQREAVRKLLSDDEFLAGQEDSWSYNAKTQKITAA